MAPIEKGAAVAPEIDSRPPVILYSPDPCQLPRPLAVAAMADTRDWRTGPLAAIALLGHGPTAPADRRPDRVLTRTTLRAVLIGTDF